MRAIGDGAVRQALDRVLRSGAFERSEKLACFLRYVVEARLAGEAEKLKQHTIAVDALGYEPGEASESAVRAHALRLRKALDTYYEGAGATDPVVIELPKGRYVPQFRERGATRPLRDVTDWWKRASLAALLAIGLASAALVVEKGGRPERTRSEQLTFIEADMTGPVGSLDGRRLVYSSDEAADGGRDLWTMETGDRTRRRRLTSHPADDYDPDLSSDEKWIVFRSMRDGGGVYVMPAGGGNAKRLSAGFRPRFSPAGQQIAYALIEEFGNAGIYVHTLDGAVRRVSNGLVNARCPVWSPDSQKLMVQGVARAADSGVREDWWVLTVDGSAAPQPVFAAKLLPHVASHVNGGGCPDDWIKDRVLNASGELNEVRLDRNLRAREAVMLHPGPGLVNPRYWRADVGTPIVYFALRRSQVDLWGAQRLPSGETGGRRWERWTADATLDHLEEAGLASLSKDGNRTAYLSKRSGHWAVWLKDQAAHAERMVASGEQEYERPIISSGGGKVAYRGRSSGRNSIRITDLTSLQARTVCEDCGELRSWSGDEKRMLSVKGHRMLEINTESGRVRELLKDSDLAPREAAYSPDGLWIALAAWVKGTDKVQGFVIPADGGNRKDWRPVAEDPYDLAMQWSPEGDMLYYFCRREEFRCLWGQRLDRQGKRAAGAPFVVDHFHGSIRIWGLGWVAVGGPWLTVRGTVATGYLFRLRR